MVNRQKNILVWIITWAGLLLLVLYSPIGSPDLYTSKKYFTANQGVQFNGEVIENAPMIKTVEGNNYQELNVPVYNSTELKNNTTYSVSNNSDNSKSNNFPTQVSSSLGSTQKSSNNEASGGGIGGTMGTFIGKTSKENTTSQTTGFMSLTTDLNALTNNTTSQSVNGYISGSGATDPGGDPLGDPIPVGDGWGLLILFGVCYILLKKRISIESYFASLNKK